MIRTLRQPGPAHPNRIDCLRGELQHRHYALTPGFTLNEALTAPLVATGLQSATVTIRNLAVSPFRYVMPAAADDDSHVAYFSAPHAPSGTSRIEQANASFGWSQGKPFVHCHATWVEPDGRRRGGHILPLETIIAEPADATAWGFHSICLDQQPDPETNFSLFQPSGSSSAGGNGLLARVKPNEDILTALETIACTHGVQNAVIRGSLGSLIGAWFIGDNRVGDHATEVLVSEGYIRNGIAELALRVVDMRGEVHQGWLKRGRNPVCITFDLIMQVQ